jgi:ABC-type amino acid transport substrate-binding protein
VLLRLAHLALVAFLVTASAAAAPAALSPPRVRSNPAWHTVTTGPTTQAQQQPPQLFALTAGSNPNALIPFGISDGLKYLDAKAALVVATTISRNGPFTFRRAAWPPRLSDFRVDHGWEGQPLARIQQRLLAVTKAGWNLDVRVYFGTQHPGKLLLASVQSELGRLLLPLA